MHRAARRVVSPSVILASAAAVRLSMACGLTPPIGPNGLPAVCHGDENAWRFRAGLSVGGTSTRIDFGDREAALLQSATAATLDVFPTERLGLSVSLGAALAGRVDYEQIRYDLLPGPLGGAGVSYRLFGGKLPFVHGSFTASMARATARAPDGAEIGRASCRERVSKQV